MKAMNGELRDRVGRVVHILAHVGTKVELVSCLNYGPNAALNCGSSCEPSS